MKRFEGKIALVTGASTGIGLETIQRLLAEGGVVYAAHRRKADGLDLGGAQSVRLDVTSEADWRTVIETVMSEAGRLDVAPLISHRFPIAQAESAYELIEENREPYLGILLRHPDVDSEHLARRIQVKPTRLEGRIGVGCLGSGNFARAVLLPVIQQIRPFHLVSLCSAGGLSAQHSGVKLGFDSVTTDAAEVLGDPSVHVVFITTRHDQHAGQVVAALRAGKHVFVEKPLCLTTEDLGEIEAALLGPGLPESNGRGGPHLMVGFNRRFSPAARAVREFFAQVADPMTVLLRFNAGAIPASHWTQDASIGGGRILGEACHAIDLATYLTGSLPVRVYAESVGGANAPVITDDQCVITLRHANGSVSSVAYLAGGDKAFPKERIEVFGGGRVAVIDDFHQVTTCVGGTTRTKRGRQDKGHRAEVAAFADALTRATPSPISWEELRTVTLASILAVQSLREGMPLSIPGC